jgi:P4 family phage/plasmid primase-like protien
VNTQFLAEQMFAVGYTDLISVTPPDAQLSPGSKIPLSALGKAPGKRLSNGLYAGYNWRKYIATPDDVRSWCLEGANVGLRADRFPGVDIDCTDEQLARIIERCAVEQLGPAPVRVGRYPKRLLMYRTETPFSRLRLWIIGKGEKHLVEILGQGQQYLVQGIHAGTGRPYEWTSAPGVPGYLTVITVEQAKAFLTALEADLTMLGLQLTHEGDGRPLTDSAGIDQEGLRAPSVDLVAEAVGKIPNTNELFPSRDDYITMAYAIRAAVGEENEADGAHIFVDWAMRWDGNELSSGNDPDVALDDYKRAKGDKRVGWSWLCEHARQFGFNDAVLTFDVVADGPEPMAIIVPEYSDQWVADRVVELIQDDIRVVPQNDQFLVWHGGKWAPDAERLAEHLVSTALRKMASRLMRTGVSEEEKKKNFRHAHLLCSGEKVSVITRLVKLDKGLRVSVSALDHDPWVINTPGGVVDLKTTTLNKPDRGALCTKATRVTPEFDAACPTWMAFLWETTGGDQEVIDYLQRLVGYYLTGSTREQQFSFLYGEGGNGKGTFMNTLEEIFGDYVRTTPFTTFAETYGEQHSTELAMLHGARLVLTSEVAEGQRWNEQRVKSLTGGDPVTARFMRQDFFTYIPQFKLLFAGNSKPEMRNGGGPAMRRRTHLVGFTRKPRKVDLELREKLRPEYPAILAWGMRGTPLFLARGLNPPKAVLDATAEYFEEEDAVGQWLAEWCDVGGEFVALTTELFTSWEQYCNQLNIKAVGSAKRLASVLVTRGYGRWRDPQSRQRGFQGIKPHNRQVFETTTSGARHSSN